jgi:hypothetical protein
MHRERLQVKVCRKCLRVKVVSEYYHNRHNQDGLDFYCKDCRLAYSKEWCTKHRDRRFLIQWRYRNKAWIKTNHGGIN